MTTAIYIDKSLAKAVIVVGALTLVGGKSVHLAHHDFDAPKHEHTEHERHDGPEKPSYTIVASGTTSVPSSSATVTVSGFVFRI